MSPEKSPSLIHQIKYVAPVFALGITLMAVFAVGVFVIETLGLMPTNPGLRTGIELSPVFAFLAPMIKAREILETYDR